MGEEGIDTPVVPRFSQLLECCPEGSVLDIGGGTAHVKNFLPDIISVDLLSFPGIDVVADAHRLPFQDGTFAGVVMLDVLHHLGRPIDFLKEASRVLKPGGRLAMLEPAMTTVARQFYHHFHEEPVEMDADPFAPVSIDPKGATIMWLVGGVIALTVAPLYFSTVCSRANKRDGT